MPEAATAPKPSFTQLMAENRPANKAELEAQTATAPKPDEKKIETQNEPVKQVSPAIGQQQQAAAQKTQADPDEEILAGKRSPKADDFKRVKSLVGEFKTKAEQAEAERAKLLKELEAAKSAPKPDVNLIKQIEAERDKYRGMFEEVAVELSPEFHAGYDAKLNAIKSGLPAEQADQLMTLLQMPDSKAKQERVLEMLADADQFTLARVALANDKVQEVLADKRGKLAKASETLGKIGAERKAKQEQQSAQLAKTFDDTLSKARENLALFKNRDGDEAWNQSVAERERIARAVFTGQFTEPTEAAEAALLAASAPAAFAQLKSASEKIAELEATIAKMTSATPGMAAQGGSQGGEKRGGFAAKMAKNTIV